MHRTFASGKQVDKTRAYIERTLSYQAPTVADVAGALGMSVRTLQRRLTDEHTSFSQLLDDCRRKRAQQLLRGSDFPLKVLHEQLGYSQRSCLSRAMRRWKPWQE